MTTTVTAAGAALVAEVAAHEGPVYSRTKDALYVTTMPRPAPHQGVASPRNSILRVQLDGARLSSEPGAIRSVRADIAAANGMALSGDGSLLVCEQGSPTEPAAITRVDPMTGDRTVIVDSWRGLPLNSPNDVVVAADGAIWFTDPTYGHLQGFRPPSHTGDLVYRHDPATGVTTRSPTTSTNPTAWPSPPTGARSTSPTAAPTTSRRPMPPPARTTWSPMRSSAAAASAPAGCSPSSCPGSRTG